MSRGFGGMSAFSSYPRRPPSETVLVHAGFAIQKIDREAAEEAMKLIQEIAEKEDY